MLFVSLEKLNENILTYMFTNHFYPNILYTHTHTCAYIHKETNTCVEYVKYLVMEGWDNGP